jgi:AraC-like DNA-binding protein
MTDPDPAQIDAAMSALLDAAIRQNLTNSALLSLRRTEARREREKAEAIHAVKDDALNSVHAAYLREEPALIAAVRGEDRGQARAIINRILTGVYFHGRNRPELLKSFVLELVVMMSRAAVEAGGDPAELLGFHYQALAELSSIRDEERLSHWLTSMLERLMNALRDHRQDPRAARLDRALRHMRSRLPEPLTRDGVARIAGLAPSYFSHLMIRTMGDSFTTLLTRMRVDHARHLLAHTDLPLSQIAQECGFADQSYFSKVFRRTTRATPRAYRRERQAGR